MRILSIKTLREFWEKHSDVEQALKSWYQEVEQASWNSPADIKVNHPSASFVADNRVVFNIKGNHYRLVVRVSYEWKQVMIKFIGSHAAYDKINVNTV